MDCVVQTVTIRTDFKHMLHQKFLNLAKQNDYGQPSQGDNMSNKEKNHKKKSRFETSVIPNTAVTRRGVVAIMAASAAPLTIGSTNRIDQIKGNGSPTIRRFDGPLQPKWFGAKFNDQSDDTDAIQSMFDHAIDEKVAIEFPNRGIAKIGGQIVLQNSSGLRVNGQHTRRKSGGSIQHDPKSSYSHLFSINNFSDIVFDGCTILGKGNIKGSYIFDMYHPKGDLDIEIRNSYLANADFCGLIKGRGLRFVNNYLTLFKEGLKLDWPLPFIEGPNGDQTQQSGMRGYYFAGIRCHAWRGGYFLLNQGRNKENLSHLAINGLLGDTNMAFFKGALHNVNASNIDIFHSAAATYMIDASSVRNSRIQGYFRGQFDSSPHNRSDRKINRFALLRNVDQLDLDVYLQYVDEHCIVLSERCKNFDIRLRGRELCKANTFNKKHYYPIEIAQRSKIGRGNIDVGFDDSPLHSGVAVHTIGAGVSIDPQLSITGRVPKQWQLSDRKLPIGLADLGQIIQDTAIAIKIPACEIGEFEIIFDDGIDLARAYCNYKLVGENITLIIDRDGSKEQFHKKTGILSGTSGEKGKFNISVHSDGKLYLENRLAATGKIYVRL